MRVTGIDHIYLSVADFRRSEAFYDAVLGAFGFRKGDKVVAGEPHAHYIRPGLQISLRPAHRATAHDPYAPGLHHLCLQVETKADVDEAHHRLLELGVTASPPRLYPEYNDEYYATFFEDPDGIRLEVVGRTRYRQLVIDRWDEFRVFLNPVADLLASDRRKEGD